MGRKDRHLWKDLAAGVDDGAQQSARLEHVDEVEQVHPVVAHQLVEQLGEFQRHQVKRNGEVVECVPEDKIEDRNLIARSLGAVWAGSSDEAPPRELDAAIIFAPVGPLVPAALKALRQGGVAVCAGIHMSDIPAFPYSLLWEERAIRSVANLTRADARAFLALAPKVPVKTSVVTLPLGSANEALEALRKGELTGAAVLIP